MAIPIHGKTEAMAEEASFPSTLQQQPQQQLQQANKLREGFVDLAENLLTSIGDVFPECDETRHALQLFRVAVKGDPSGEDTFVRRCTDLFKQNSARLKERDASALFAVVDGIPLLRGADIRTKWSDPDFSEESKQNLWQYLSALETYGGLYCAVPAGVMGRIEQVATSISSKLQEGTLDIASIDITAFGEDLMAGLSPEEMKDFEGSLPDVYSCVGNVASMLARQTGNDSFDADALMSKVVQMQAGAAAPGAPAPNLGNFIQELSGSMCPGLDVGATNMVASLAQQMLTTAAPPSSTNKRLAVTAALADDGREGGAPAGGNKRRQRRRR